MKELIAEMLQIENRKDLALLEPKHRIENNNWNYKSDVKASFNVGYDNDHIYLVYLVEESNIKAIHTLTNQAVFEDSCVEFFICFNGNTYYNLEFNCIGTVLGGYGKGRTNRELLDPLLLEKISTIPSLGTNKVEIIDCTTEWNLKINIPRQVFKYSDIESFEGKQARCNFYKCGDKQVFPHYLSWSPISTESPDFHKPEFFGKISLE